VRSQRLAMFRAPSPLEPWHGPPRKFSYTAEVQPVLDKHCVRCHAYGNEGGRKLNLAGALGLAFNTSYIELRSKYVHVVGAGPHQTQLPKTWGSHASALSKVFFEGHARRELDRDIHLTPEDIDRVTTWIDINAPYYPDYAGGAYRDHLYGRCPLSPAEVKRLSELVGLPLADRKHIAAISFTRPELSPCLANLSKTDPKHSEALAILHAGRNRLAEHPRPDMPGFQLTDPTEIRQEAKYQSRLEVEATMRQAIAEGKKAFSRAR